MKKIAVLSAGTDNCGINSAVRAVVRTAISGGAQVYGIESGFRGLVEDHFVKLNSRNVSGKIGKPGCFLGSSKPSYLNKDTAAQALANLNKKSIDGLIVIGGGGTFAAANKYLEQNEIGGNIPVIGIPSTVQDDIPGTDTCIGVDTAVNNIMEAVDHIRSCDSSRNRSFLIEVEGRTCGSLAMRAALVCGAEVVLTPEMNANQNNNNPQSEEEELEKLAKQIENWTTGSVGKTQCICMIARGWKPGIKKLDRYLTEKMGESDLMIRVTVLGHIQRGGSPTAYDRLLGTQFGSAATKALLEGHKESFVALKENKVQLVKFDEVVDKQKQMSEFEEIFRVTTTL